jgi:hypothetical protein
VGRVGEEVVQTMNIHVSVKTIKYKEKEKKEISKPKTLNPCAHYIAQLMQRIS